MRGVMQTETPRIDRFFRVLVEEIRRSSPEFLEVPFTVAEIYQSLIPYHTHRDLLGVEMNGDYEDALMRLIVGEGGYLILESEPARLRIRRELENANPNTGLYRDFAAVDVRVNPEKVSKEEAEGDGLLGTALIERGGELATVSSPPSDLDQRVRGGPGLSRPIAEDVPDLCPACDTRLPERKSLCFCPVCGTDVRLLECSKCEELLERGWKYCVACGTPVGT